MTLHKGQDIHELSKSFPPDRLTHVTHHDDGSVSTYLGHVWLANEDTHEESKARALRAITASDNGAEWTKTIHPGLDELRKQHRPKE